MTGSRLNPASGHPRGESATVLIIGAGPAGLVLGNLLRAAEIDCLIAERQSREHVERRARAGLLAANSVRILAENGLATGLLKNGQHHDTCAFRSDHTHFELKRISRQAMTASSIKRYQRDHAISWLAILVEANLAIMEAGALAKFPRC
ncbi:MAG: FAD-dependent monooxygenase [Pseudonocardiaceae bacterium]